jgi:YQGE family putative transporter
MMKTIDVVAGLEKRNEYTYILSHEFGLFFGRAFGLLLFILLAYGVSENFALKYALVVVGGLQLLAYPLSKNIINQTNTIENETRS